MAGLKLNHIYKVYPNGTKAVSDFTMDIQDKEFIIFVGPSGCGKSTTLRMIAGLEDITTGELSIDGTVVNGIEPKDRDIAMVFQNYALYPHMTVFDNMAFGLKLRKMPKEEIKNRVEEAAQILGLTDYLKKKPGEMSGGQRQRVALGRAIVREPKVFLLDEPLSNLDAKLRTQMRSEILKLHQKLQTTFIYVTHDQVEAMTMGTRIVVMKDGFVQQIDTPRNLYNYPCNKFVAGFIGTPQMNFFSGLLKTEGDNVRITFDGTGVNLLAPKKYFTKVNPKYLDGSKSVSIGIRAEHISPDASAYPYKATCKVSHYEDLGTDCQVYGDFAIDNAEMLDSATKVVLKAPAGTTYERDSLLEVSLDVSHIHLFDAETEETIAPRIPTASTITGTVTDHNLQILDTLIPLPEAIEVADGECTIQVPPSAITLAPRARKGYVKAKLAEIELINNDRLLKLVSGDTTVYALIGQDDETEYKDNLTVYFNIDLKRISIYKDNEEVVAPLPLDNMLEGKISARKVEVAVGEINPEEDKYVSVGVNLGIVNISSTKKVDQRPKVKGYVLDLHIAQDTKEIPEGFGRLLLASGAGKKLFENTLVFHFSPYDAQLIESDTEQGIVATVEKILDYGTEKFAVCTVEQPVAENDKKAKGKKEDSTATKATSTIIVAIDDANIQSDIQLKLDINKLSVTDPERDIKLV